MVKKFLNNKIILIISILFSVNINNINCGDGKGQIELQKNSFININGDKLDISGSKFTEEEITNNFNTEEKIIKFIFEKFRDKEINISESGPCKLKDSYKIDNLTIFPWAKGENYKYFNNIKQKNELFEAFGKSIKRDKKMIITLKNKPHIVPKIYCKYCIKNEIQYAFDQINNEIKKYNYVTLEIIKKTISKLSSKKLIDVNDIVVYKNEKEKYEGTEVIKTYNNSIIITLSNFEKYYNKRSATIEYVLPENLELEEKVKKTVDSIDDNFQPDDMYIHKFFKKKYGLEDRNNCVLEGFSDKQKKYVNIPNNARFFLGTKIRITIKSEIPGFTKKKTKIYKPDKDKIYINLKFEVTDNSNFKLKQDVNNINNIEVEQGKIYNDLLNIIKQHLGGRDLKEGFKIYKNDKNNEFTTGAIENNVTYIIVFDNDDINFVDKINPKNPQKSQDETEKNNNTKDIKKTKKGGYSGKDGKKGCC